MASFKLEGSLESILNEAGLSVERFHEDVQALQNWIKTQPHLPHYQDETRLQHHILNKKFSMEKAKKKIDMYYTVRNFVPELFANRDPLSPQIQNAMDQLICCPMPKLTPDLERLNMISLKYDEVDKFIPWDFYTYIFMLGDIRLSCDFSKSDVLVVDMKNFKLGQITKLNPTIFMKTYVVMTQAYGQKLNAVHLLNAPAYVETFLQMIKPFMLPKLFNRIHLHKGYDTIKDIYPLECLPKEYGGTGISIVETNEMWNKEVIQWRDWFLEEMKIKSDESKRPEKLEDDMFGSVHGSFRKLDVD